MFPIHALVPLLPRCDFQLVGPRTVAGKLRYVHRVAGTCQAKRYIGHLGRRTTKAMDK